MLYFYASYLLRPAIFPLQAEKKRRLQPFVQILKAAPKEFFFCFPVKINY
jgi:hypothetical protein